MDRSLHRRSVQHPPLLASSNSSINRPHRRPQLRYRFFVFRSRDTVKHDSRARLQVHGSAAHDEGSDGDSGVHHARVADVAHGTSVNTAPLRLQLRYELNSHHFRGA